MLDAVVEDCVNAVGVDVNTARCPAGTGVGFEPSIAQQIVSYRDGAGAFSERAELLKVPGWAPNL